MDIAIILPEKYYSRSRIIGGRLWNIDVEFCETIV